MPARAAAAAAQVPGVHEYGLGYADTLLGMENRLESNVSFRLGMSIYRRRNILNALTSKDSRRKEAGRDILAKFEEQVRTTPALSIRLSAQKNANLECLPSLPARKIPPLHRRTKTVI